MYYPAEQNYSGGGGGFLDAYLRNWMTQSGANGLSGAAQDYARDPAEQNYRAGNTLALANRPQQPQEEQKPSKFYGQDRDQGDSSGIISGLCGAGH